MNNVLEEQCEFFYYANCWGEGLNFCLNQYYIACTFSSLDLIFCKGIKIVKNLELYLIKLNFLNLILKKIVINEKYTILKSKLQNNFWKRKKMKIFNSSC